MVLTLASRVGFLPPNVVSSEVLPKELKPQILFVPKIFLCHNLVSFLRDFDIFVVLQI